MIKASFNYFKTIPSVYIDGFIYVAIAVLQFLAAAFGDDESAKYIGPLTLYWLKRIVGTLAAGFLALKLYRSTAFADHVKEKKEETKTWKKEDETNKPPVL